MIHAERIEPMDKAPGITTRRRALALMYVLVGCFAALVLRLGHIQLVWGAELQARALELRTRDVPVAPRRGVIYDRRGRELAVSLDVASVYVHPNLVVNPEQTAQTLALVLELHPGEVLRRITRVSSFEWVRRGVEEAQARRLRELNLTGVGFAQESRRFYLRDNLASHVIGIAGVDSQGLEGLELVYDRELRGTPGRIVQEVDARGRALTHAIHRYVPAVDGKSLVLTIDETIQHIVERELDALITTTQAQSAMAIFMDPATGQILALANRPDYNPNRFPEYPPTHRRNLAVVDAFPPGSTLKPLVAAGALELGLARVQDRFYCAGSIITGGWTINCHRTHGSLDLLESIKYSCNVAFANLGMRMGATNFHNNLVAFGLTGRTGIDLPGEAAGMTVPPSRIKQVDLAVMAFGQTLTVTPLQLLTATAALANGGVLMTPYLVQEIRSHDGSQVQVIQPRPVRRAVSESTAAEIRRGMELVVKGGTGLLAAVDGYEVAGKTGTSQKVIDGVLVRGRYIASFVGFAPADRPRLAGLVMVNEPVGPYFGGRVAAPAFAAMVRDILRYLDVPPTVVPSPAAPAPRVRIPDVQHLVVGEAVSVMERAGLAARPLGEGPVVVGQFPVAGAEVPRGTTVVLHRNQGGAAPAGAVTVPRLTGKTITEAGTILSRLGLRLQAEGRGFAREQEPAPGVRVYPGDTVRVRFVPPP
ncbi:MAG TPA: stage V sporulation protein D [Clostridiales bacterium UBA8153]|nr:stage V sporulation protein D [Clostridiales bacterium UBA8153]